MYIMPDTEVRLIRDCPLLPTYEHTIWFDDLQDQYEYFSSLKNIKFEKVSYQRHTKNTIKLTILADKIYDCNYMMFRNKAFGNKWFYAFINKIEYVSNTTSLIEYQIDVMQTWLFDYNMKQCFVEREHVMDDTIGSNLVPENLEKGDYVITNEKTYNVYPDIPIVCMFFSEKPKGTPSDEFVFVNFNKNNLLIKEDKAVAKLFEPDVYSGVALPCYIVCFYYDNAKYVLDNMCKMVASSGKADSIISISTMPKILFDTSKVEYPEPIKQLNIIDSTINLPKLTPSKKPKNNKLLTYPYVCSTCLCGSTENIYKYELFDTFSTGQQPSFLMECCFSLSTTICLTPQLYKNALCRDETISFSSFPLLPWVTDYYQNWLAQNKSRLDATIENSLVSGATQTISGIALGIAGIFTKSPSLAVSGFSSALGGVSNVYTAHNNVVAEKTAQQAVPDNIRGSLKSADVLGYSYDKNNIIMYCKSIRPEFIDIIDDFFDKYGYACHLVKTPNRNGRKSWNYVKTVGCNISGGVPADDTKSICSIYDNGITFWKNGKTIGDYTQDNSL